MTSEQGAGVEGFREGSILAGKYRIERVLGRGGMGAVVAAHHLALDSKVAIKFLLPELIGNEEAVARFTREARVAAKLRGEHVARVLDVGLEQGAPFIVMELLEGVDLHDWSTRRGPLPVHDAVDFVLQASDAIEEAHGLGIVHRDLKPSNLYCVRRPNGTVCIKVLDFGISKFSAPGSAPSLSMTRTSALMGTPLYMAPEQMESPRDVDARADLWALGVIIFQMLTGTLPFSGETLPELCLKIATRPPQPLRSLRADAPEWLERAVLKCLEKDRRARFQTVAELRAAITPFAPPGEASSRRPVSSGGTLSSETIGAPASSIDWASSLQHARETLGPVGRTDAGQARPARRRLAIGAVVGVVAAAAALLGAAMIRPAATPSIAASTTSASILSVATATASSNVSLAPEPAGTAGPAAATAIPPPPATSASAVTAASSPRAVTSAPAANERRPVPRTLPRTAPAPAVPRGTADNPGAYDERL